MKRFTLFICLVLVFLLTVAASGSVSEADDLYIYRRVSDIFIGSQGSNPSHLTVFNNKLYFSANDGFTDCELYVYDRTSPPSLVYSINDDGDSSPASLTVYNSKLYFSADDGTHGRELWVYDGINPPTIVADIYSGALGSNPGSLRVFNGKLYFAADGGDGHGRELWVYDEINPPAIVADINSGSGGSSPASLAVFNNKLYFSAYDAINGRELWVYDGVNPPAMVADINSGSGGSSPASLAVFNGKLYFGADDGINGKELWVYDGSNPPSMMANLNSGSANSYPSGMTEFNGKLYFRAVDGVHGAELWMFDGTNPPGMVADIKPGGLGSSPQQFEGLDGRLYFSADEGVNGRELWVYDGSNPPTLAANIAPGLESSNPGYLTVFNSRLYFQADDRPIDYLSPGGNELWVYYGVDIQKDLFASQAVYDGWVLESGEDTTRGELINASNLTCIIGDDAQNRQFRTILSFDTSRIPDNAVFTKVTLQYKQHSIIGSDPYATHGRLWADIKQGSFYNNPALQKADFSAIPSRNYAGYFVYTPSRSTYPIYRATITAGANKINTTGITQFRLRFALDDDNDNQADYIKIFCGEMGAPLNRPLLRVWYYIP